MHDPGRPASWDARVRSPNAAEDRNAADHKTTLWRDLTRDIDALLTGEPDATANAANAAAALFHGLPRLNWAGFYFLRDQVLVLGPFQGRPACVRIALGAGVCGTAAQQRRSIVVPDVEAFPGHIACDSASRSELVIPLIHNGEMAGVLDLDSPDLNRFDAADQAGAEALVLMLVRHLKATPTNKCVSTSEKLPSGTKA